MNRIIQLILIYVILAFTQCSEPCQFKARSDQYHQVQFIDKTIHRCKIRYNYGAYMDCDDGSFMYVTNYKIVSSEPLAECK